MLLVCWTNGPAENRPLDDPFPDKRIRFKAFVLPRRAILSERQCATLFDLPTDEPSLLRHYTLADDDVEHIRAKRRPRNRLGFVLQLCALRYPGRLLTAGEAILVEVISFIAAQLGMHETDLDGYAILPSTGFDPGQSGEFVFMR